MSAHGDHDMGHTVAGWTGSALATTGFAVAGAALVLSWAPGLWAGGALTALGALAAWLLHVTGWGKPTGPRPPHLRHWRTPDPAGRSGHPDCLGCRLARRHPHPTAVGAATPVPSRSRARAGA